MTPDHCAAMLREADPDRFASVMAAEARDRPRLATLYAANLEIARAAVASKEPLINEMRLQFWADQIAGMVKGEAPAAHEVATPLYEAWGSEIAPLSALVDARRRDALREPFRDDAELLDHIDGCTGNLMSLAALGCGYDGDAELIRLQARGAGLAAWLGVYDRIRAMNMGLFPESPARLAALAETGLAAFDAVRGLRSGVGRRVAPALYAGAGARARLMAVRDGKSADISIFRQNFSRLSLALLGRWQG
ncbi:squalene/phytoene synthase family protein [Paracoccus sp. SCSIO 75233]|uniref:squalene/phytoene synthase family protein n=1 Tax=Paracoccus sp. SCSIO 75233 TaxID=3017782 RepID=UPI0022F033B1|nr:squalene/phytoene synthase family protein [Paracoccus sp. SCSIO 75233]WBU54344.1 squalene/phytoene synthase family protein [Paracoccus sp. SCSIO 75233]